MRGSRRSPGDAGPRHRRETAPSRAFDGRIAFAGPAADLPAAADSARADRLRGALDHARPRSTATRISSSPATGPHEFELRLKGASYEEIARAGGGILSTVQATRAASEDDLVASRPAPPRPR